jgi:Na+-driven multidrug efflux pump
MLAFPLIGFQMVVTNFFQCIGKVKISIFLSLSRQLLILVPMLAILPLFFNLDGVWYALPASDATASLIAFVIMTIYMRKFKRQFESSQLANS